MDIYKLFEICSSMKVGIDQLKDNNDRIYAIIKENMPERGRAATQAELDEFEARAAGKFTRVAPAEPTAGGGSIKNKRKTKRRKSKTKRRKRSKRHKRR